MIGLEGLIPTSRYSRQLTISNTILKRNLNEERESSVNEGSWSATTPRTTGGRAGGGVAHEGRQNLRWVLRSPLYLSLEPHERVSSVLMDGERDHENEAEMGVSHRLRWRYINLALLPN
jgi:hypothetical protein